MAFCRANTLHSLLSWMGHLIQCKNNIKITRKELSNPVVHTYKVASILCFFYLSIKRWLHAAQQLNIIGYNIFF